MANINDINGSSKIKDTYTTIYNNDDAINTELESHLSSLVAHLASEISNDSGVTGTKVSDALDTIKTVVDNINAGDSNADIGLYTINDTTNTDYYVGDLGTTTLFGDMHLVLYAENENTDVATLDITDGNGAKTIKKQNKDGTKSDLRAGDLYGFNLLKYDGTDWVIVREKTTENTINSSFYANSEKYIGNVKTIDTFQDDSVWTSTAGTQSQDSTNVKIGDYNLKIEENDATGSLLESEKNGITLDLSTTNNGETSPDTDYINLVCYVSDVNAINTSGSLPISIEFDQDTPYTGTNTKQYIITSGISTGWNYFKIKKSDFTTNGTGAWSGIQSIRLYWESNDAFTGEYVSFQLIQLVKKDPIADYPNPFQVNAVRELDIVNSEWFIGNEFGKIIMRDLESDGTESKLFSTKYLGKNAIAEKKVEVLRTNGDFVGGIELSDGNNNIRCRINSNSFTLSNADEGTIEKSFPMNFGDIITFTIIRNNDDFLFKTKNINTGFTLYIQATKSSIGDVRIGSFQTNGIFENLLSLNITEISHAHHADIAETAKSLVEMPKARIYNSANQSILNASTTSLTFDSIRYDNRTHFDSDNATRLTFKENGLYNIKANIEFASNATGERHLSIRLNGSTIIGRVRVNANSTSQTNLSLSTSYELSKGDYLEVRVYQDSTVSLDVANAGNYSPEFMIEKVGE